MMERQKPTTFLITLATLAVIIGLLVWWSPAPDLPANPSDELLSHWQELYQQGRLAEARPVLQSYLGQNPADSTARRALADIWWRQGSPEEALAEMRRIDSSLESGGATSFLTGVLALRLGETTAAIDDLQVALDEDPGSFQLRLEIIRALVAAGQKESAAAYREGLEPALPQAVRALMAGSATPVHSAPDVFLTEKVDVVTSGTVAVSGVVSGPEAHLGVSMAVVGDDGRFWRSDDLTWSAQPFTYDVSPEGVTGVDAFWRYNWSPPPTNGGLFWLVFAAKRTSEAQGPMLPVVPITVDNKPPAISTLGLFNGASRVAKRDVLLRNDVTGASWMRFSEGLDGLSTSPYLPYESSHTVTLSGQDGRKIVYGQWRDDFGNETTAGISAGRTSFVLDTKPPEIAAVFPRPGADDVNVDLLLTVNFAGSGLDRTTIGRRSLMLLTAAGDRVLGAVRYDSQANTAVFSPQSPLVYGQEYEVVLTTDIRDEVGNALEEDRRWRFKTVVASDHPPMPPEEVTVVSGREANLISWAPPTGIDSGGDFEPPVRGGYNIYRGLDRERLDERVNQVPLTALKYVDRDYGQPGTYYYTVKAIDAGGAESQSGPIRSNRLIKASFLVPSTEAQEFSTSNGQVTILTAPATDPVTLTIKSRRLVGGPASPIDALELETDESLQLQRLAVVIPGDPTGALFLRKIGSGWQPLLAGRYIYDLIAGSVSYGPLPTGGLFVLVNPDDQTAPIKPQVLRTETDNGVVSLTWPAAADKESGIDRYRLYFSDNPLDASLSVPAITDTSVAQIYLDVDSDQLSFTDNRSGRALRYYAVVAVNGAGLESSATTAAPIMSSARRDGHQPALVDAGSCRACHLAAPITGEGEVDCGLCHDGTGSKVALRQIKAGSKSCQGCHRLRPAQLVIAGAEPAGQCGGCHEEAGETSITPGMHWSDSGLTGAGCQSCHSLHDPQGEDAGYLVNPYNARMAWKGNRVGFCFSCHDGSRLPEATETPGRYITVSLNRTLPESPQAAGMTRSEWEQSSHTRVTECMDCHPLHLVSDSDLVGDDRCFKCHDGQSDGGVQLIAVADESRTGHASQTSSCSACHNVHVGNKRPRRQGSNRAAGALKGVIGATVINGEPGTLPRFITVGAAVYEYEVCFNCHSDTLAALFNPANPSYHPVEGPIHDQGIDKEAFSNGWRSGMTMYCSDCHQAGEEEAAGPHSSKFKSLLPEPFGAAAPEGRKNDLCWRCHDQAVYSGEAPGTRFIGAGGHGGHVSTYSIDCYQCHDVHGNSFSKHLIRIVTGVEASGTIAFSHDSTGGACLANCHEDEKVLRRYSHAY